MKPSEIKIKAKKILSKLTGTKGKYSFLNDIVDGGKVLDVGCGNNSPYLVKSLRPDVYYVGLDIDTCGQTMDDHKCADELILTKAETFHSKIEDFSEEFDGIICSHNLEHCNNPWFVTSAMVGALKQGGTIYISFPCEESVNFPSRKGCLNFYDDSTHNKIINFSAFLNFLQSQGLVVLFAKKRYRPVIPFLIGLVSEPFCRLMNMQAVAGGSWALYGFESIIIARKKDPA